MSHARTTQLRDLQNIIEEISGGIMWVNDREEEELVFDWGDKNIYNYIPRKQESYSVRRHAQSSENNIPPMQMITNAYWTGYSDFHNSDCVRTAFTVKACINDTMSFDPNELRIKNYCKL